MYGTRSAIFMDVTNPRVAGTQFTAYMAMMNLAISYSATWQGIAAEAIGYPQTLLIDGLTGLLCLAVLPFIKPSLTPDGDGGAGRRARRLAALLALGCVAAMAYRLGAWDAGKAAPMFEILFMLVFVASAVFLGTGAVVLGAATPQVARVGRLGLLMAPLLVAMYLRKWWPEPQALYVVVPALAALLLAWQARLPWTTLKLEPRPA
jgi:PAT family beta-lactamase induction signal transducer AmpG